MLVRQNIRFVNLLPWKISSFCQHVKDDLGQKNLDVYNIPYNCLMKEHHWHIHLALPDQSAVAEHRFSGAPSSTSGHPNFHLYHITWTRTSGR